ncbi:hypothetical protein Sjap_024357 [Stephania japonica]|uniref:Uncharacterized protein n=1 Tax=Stephania japonica TaxID=461633 RepID=A0AAP0ED91_9MAGN
MRLNGHRCDYLVLKGRRSVLVRPATHVGRTKTTVGVLLRAHMSTGVDAPSTTQRSLEKRGRDHQPGVKGVNQGIQQRDQELPIVNFEEFDDPNFFDSDLLESLEKLEEVNKEKVVVKEVLKIALEKAEEAKENGTKKMDC